jgi:tubulin polyglutamylase TTLL1
MKELARDAVKAIYCRIDREKKEHCFELFGLDFIVDSAFKPTLIEINTNPCLELSAPILERLIPRMMENAFRLCIDPIFRPKIECACSKSESYYIYDETFLERNKFTLIFDEKYDRDFEWE